MPVTIPPFTDVPSPGDPVASAWAQALTQFAVDDITIGPTAPTNPNAELWYDTADGGVSYANLALVESGTWTPTFTIMVPGTGAGINANYVFVGAQGVGAMGFLAVEITVTLGTGFTVWGSGARVNIPSGFNWNPVSHPSLGLATYEKTSNGARYYGRTSVISTTLLSAGYYQVETTTIRDGVLTASIPFTWVTGDRYHFQHQGRAVRV